MFSTTERIFLNGTSLDSIIFTKDFNFKKQFSKLESIIEYSKIKSKSQNFRTDISLNEIQLAIGLSRNFKQRRIGNDCI